MIIYAEGWDPYTRTTSVPSYPMAINTKDVLYAMGSDGVGTSTLIYLRHNVTDETDGKNRTEPTWIRLNMKLLEFYEKWKEAEEKEP